MEPLPHDEVPVAVGALAELDWLAEQIAAETSDGEALERQVNIAHVLFTGLDADDAAPVLRGSLVRIDEPLPLDRIAEAHDRVDAHNRARVVLSIPS